jgi:hypothetical protein
MIRTANIKQETVHILENVSDLSYAWETLGDYLDTFHERIRCVRKPLNVAFAAVSFTFTPLSH